MRGGGGGGGLGEKVLSRRKLHAVLRVHVVFRAAPQQTQTERLKQATQPSLPLICSWQSLHERDALVHALPVGIVQSASGPTRSPGANVFPWAF